MRHQARQFVPKRAASSARKGVNMRVAVEVEEIERTNAALGDMVREAGYHCAWGGTWGDIIRTYLYSQGKIGIMSRNFP